MWFTAAYLFPSGLLASTGATMSHGDISSALRGGLSGSRFPTRQAFASGIVVLASNGKVSYLNQLAREWLMRLNRTETSSARNGLLPKALAALVDEILALPQNGVEDRNWRRLSATRLAGAPGQFLFVQAFASPRDPHSERPVIVLMMRSSSAPVESIG
jgi:hypothetical protein